MAKRMPTCRMGMRDCGSSCSIHSHDLFAILMDLLLLIPPRCVPSAAWCPVAQAAFGAAAGGGPALPRLPAYPPLRAPQPSALVLAADVACVSVQTLADELAAGRPAQPAAAAESGLAPGAATPISAAGPAGEPYQAPAALAAWLLGVSVQGELRSAWVRVTPA